MSYYGHRGISEEEWKKNDSCFCYNCGAYAWGIRRNVPIEVAEMKCLKCGYIVEPDGIMK